MFDLLGNVLAQQATPTVTPVGTAAPGSEFAAAQDRDDTRTDAGGGGILLAALVGKPVINWLRDRGIGKSIRIEGPAESPGKDGHAYHGRTDLPDTAGAAYGHIHGPAAVQVLLLPLGIVVSCGILGGVDDYMSTIGHNRGGMTAQFKMAWLLVISTIAAFILYYPLGWHDMNVPFLSAR